MSHRRSFAVSLFALAWGALGCSGLTGLHADDDGCPYAWGCKAVAGPEASAAPDPWPTPPAAAPGATEIIVGPNGLVNAICNATNHYGSTFPSQSKVIPTAGDACSGTTVNEHGAVVTSAACAPAFWAKGQAYPGTLEANWATVLCGGTTPPAVKLKWSAKINGVYPQLDAMVLCGKQMTHPNQDGADFATSSWAPPIDATEPVGTAYMHSHQPLLVTSTGCSVGSWAGGVGQHTCDTLASAGHELAAGGGLFNDIGGGSVDFLFGFHLGPGQPGRNAVRSVKSLLAAGVFDADTCAPLASAPSAGPVP